MQKHQRLRQKQAAVHMHETRKPRQASQDPCHLQHLTAKLKLIHFQTELRRPDPTIVITTTRRLLRLDFHHQSHFNPDALPMTL
jgi:hypothetical protein